jgi:hypothetical protein
MRSWFREGFYFGLALALGLAVFLMWLWGGERQVRLHTDHLLGAIEKRDWNGFAGLISEDYHDQWNNDHALVVQRTREVFSYLRGIRVVSGYAIVLMDQGSGRWEAKVTIEGGDSELTAAVKERVNSLETPFQLEWRHVSAKPWDWKLARVSNETLQIPSEYR